MGLFMRTTIFRTADPAGVHAALAGFRAPDAFELHEPHNGWTVLDWASGEEWALLRETQLQVSKTLGCPGLLLFVYDGDNWGYELFDHGEPGDRFVQDPEEGSGFFPGENVDGDPDAISAAFPGLTLDRDDIAAYLPHYPTGEDDTEWDVPARPGDRYRRGDECASLDFLALLGVAVTVVDHRVTWPAPVIGRR